MNLTYADFVSNVLDALRGGATLWARTPGQPYDRIDNDETTLTFELQRFMNDYMRRGGLMMQARVERFVPTPDITMRKKAPKKAGRVDIVVEAGTIPYLFALQIECKRLNVRGGPVAYVRHGVNRFTLGKYVTQCGVAAMAAFSAGTNQSTYLAAVNGALPRAERIANAGGSPVPPMCFSGTSSHAVTADGKVAIWHQWIAGP
ncbi:MAG: hypothetical protein WBA31_10145 [Candidatus Dormiibacterota bacterium]